ncbi:hypothetical protein [Conchiformibius kuhniae]|uniref:Uncharacterized protein n=1 Tax=Conchiformibius kuhniae TaxID=211502 RepID=A0A8T9MY17_9NEIS|nr:hypothetical protein [Conchiformibius kuhniae]UOP05316.1 hypothetical protein LVJ77_03710 [Conchiformibius kuhniae]
MIKIHEKGVFALSVSSLDENRHLTPRTTSAQAMQEYLRLFTSLLAQEGISKDSILFDEISEGCTQIALRPPLQEFERLASSLRMLGEIPFKKILNCLKQNGHRATLLDTQGVVRELIPDTVENFCYEVYQEDVFRGRLVQIGGKGKKNVSLTLADDDGSATVSLMVESKELAQKLAMNLYRFMECKGGGILRFHPDDFEWKPVGDKFCIYDFELLDEVNDAVYEDWLSRFRAVDSEWRYIADPIAKLESIREG